MFRGDFLKLSILALSAATLGIISEEKFILWGDGLHDDTEALQALIDGKNVRWSTGEEVEDRIINKTFMLTDTIHMEKPVFATTFMNNYFTYPKGFYRGD